MSDHSSKVPSPTPVAPEAPTLPGNDAPIKSRPEMEQADPIRLREDLCDAQERLGFVLESIKDYALMLLDVHGTITGWSAGAEQILGFSEKEILGQKVHRIFSPEDIAAKIPEQEMELSQTIGRATDDRWHMRKDGTRFWATGYMRPLFLFEKEKQLRGYAKLIRDLTASKQAEDRIKLLHEEREAVAAVWAAELEGRVKQRTEELVHMQQALHQAEKLEAIGRLAGGVAHDFNNLMTGILGIAEDLQKRLMPASADVEDMDQIIGAARKAAVITKQLLAFGRRQVVNPRVLNLNEVISAMDGLFRRLLGEDIEMTTVLDPQLGSVHMDPGNLEQVVLNLGLNARDAMLTGGKLTLQTSNMDLEEGHLKGLFDVKPGPYVVVTVSDSGSGMSQETLKHMFEPFFSTKGEKGTGLGLANVYGIVKKANGDIVVESAPGKGTTFRIYFPRVEQSPDPERRRFERREAGGGSETILVTEDEDIVRRVVVRALRKKGYTVLHARSGQAAIDICDKHEGPIDLLLTDVIMPGMNGNELAKLVVPKRPNMAVLYMSGYNQELIAERGGVDPTINFIEKTFSPEGLCHKVREVLDAAKQAPHV